MHSKRLTRLTWFILACVVPLRTLAASDDVVGPRNLLKNPTFEFHAFMNHRAGQAVSYTSHNVAFWNTAQWGDVTVVREANAPATIRPAFSTGNLASIEPGKRFWQFFTLPETRLAHGDRVSLTVFGHQSRAGQLRARIKLMKLDSEDGQWSPADEGLADKRTFPRHARGELVVAHTYETGSDAAGTVELKVEGVEILGRFHTDNQSRSADINTIGIVVEFENTGAEQDGTVWVYSPCLCRGDRALARLPTMRPMTPYYRYIPRTIQKLWKGQTIHILVMGSSIDRGSANPPMYLYDEDSDSPTFKHPLSERIFEPDKVGRPDLAGYVGWWQHYFGYSGRLRLELMRKFDLPVSKICLNVMACDGSCVGEAHSGLAAYCSLSLPPGENTNGHGSGKTWHELYPELFERPEGPGPDLVIFGSGANEKTDTPDEVAVFEGTIRWLQRHDPGVEFLFCQFQNRGGYTSNPGDLQALALRYQIPMLDCGKMLDDVSRWCNPYALVPSDGHPQAAAHYLWFKELEKAFECWDPIMPGQTQLRLPERLHRNSYGWEGEMITFDAASRRLVGGKFVFEDTAINCWGTADEGDPVPYVDGQQLHARRKFPRRDLRNSLFRYGRCRLGDRHVLELRGKGARLTYVDAKVCPNRRFLGVNRAGWNLSGAQVETFASQWGAPYGSHRVMLQPGKALSIDVVGTDCSVAYADAPDAGTLRVEVDGVERFVQPANQPFVDIEGRKHFMENRKGLLGLGFGLHRIRLEAIDAPVAVLGVFTYDSRSNRSAERRLVGRAAPGEVVTFSAPFKARPVVLTHGGLAVRTEDITPSQVTFGGSAAGIYEVIGESSR